MPDGARPISRVSGIPVSSPSSILAWSDRSLNPEGLAFVRSKESPGPMKIAFAIDFIMLSVRILPMNSFR